jgi:hypothetical protein
MPVSKNHVNAVVEAAEDEGNPALHIAPSKASVPGIPPDWARVLASPDARTEVLKVLWDPMARRVPKILKQMKRSLQGVGVLTTDSRPPSIIYFFTLEDKDPHFYRGYAPTSKLSKVAGQLPSEFVEFYRVVHDGWVDQFAFMGPKRSSDWSPLGNNPRKPSSKFLVVLTASGGAMLGFDLEESPALCYVLPEGDDSPEVVPKVWAELDEWISVQMEELLPFKK